MIPSLDATNRPLTHPEHDGDVLFRSINEIIDAADNVDSFWDLDPCGRIRVLLKITPPGLNVKPAIEVISRAARA
jgi:hypothetical protein